MMRLLTVVWILFVIALVPLGLPAAEAADDAEDAKEKVQADAEASVTSTKEDSTDAEDSDAVLIYEAHAQFLGNQQGLSDDVESILIFQLSEDSADEELKADQIILAHNGLDPSFELKEDQTYTLGLSKKPNASAVLWVVEHAALMEVAATAEPVAIPEMQEPALPTLTVTLLDSGTTWLCHAVDAKSLVTGSRVQIEIPGADIAVKAQVGAHDGTFFILHGPSLRAVSSLVKRKQTVTIKTSVN